MQRYSLPIALPHTVTLNTSYDRHALFVTTGKPISSNGMNRAIDEPSTSLFYTCVKCLLIRRAEPEQLFTNTTNHFVVYDK